MREDGVILVKKKDRFVVEFSDGTRITSLNVNTSAQKSTPCVLIENPAFAKVEYNHSGKCNVELPGDFSIQCFDECYKITKQDIIALTLTRTGELDCTVKPACSVNVPRRYAVSHSLEMSRPLLTGNDCAGMQYSVLCTGQITKKGRVKIDSVDDQSTSMSSPKVFVVHEDDRCYELHPNELLQEAIQKANDDVNSLVISEEVPQCSSCKATTIITSQCSKNQSTGLEYSEKSIVPVHLKNIPFQEVGSRSSWRRFGVSVGKALMIGTYNKPVSAPQHKPKKVLTYRQFIQLPRDCSGSVHSIIAKYVQLHHFKEENVEGLLPFTLQKMNEEPVPFNLLHSHINPAHLISLFEAEQTKNVAVNSSNKQAVPKPREGLFVHKFDEHIPKGNFPLPYFKSSEGLKVVSEGFQPFQNSSISTQEKYLPHMCNSQFSASLRASTLPQSAIIDSDSSPFKASTMPCEGTKIISTKSSWDGKSSSSFVLQPGNPTPYQDSCVRNPCPSEIPEGVYHSIKPKMNGQEMIPDQHTHEKQPSTSPVQLGFTSAVPTKTNRSSGVSNVKVNLNLNFFPTFCTIRFVYI